MAQLADPSKDCVKYKSPARGSAAETRLPPDDPQTEERE